RRRLDTNPMRCFDCKVPADRELMAGAPTIADYLCPACREHFAQVQAYLKAFGVPYVLEPRLVRGLDYYRRTAFEVTQPGLGAQNAVLGGGRYDGLVEDLGGPPVPGFGFAIGEDRLILSLPQGSPLPNDAPDVYIVALGEAAVAEALLLGRRLRQKNGRVVFDPLPDKSLKGHMRRANDRRARAVLIVGEKEVASGLVTLKRMSDGAQETFPRGDLEAWVGELVRG
ncbi:MAG TPA: His/Gly/Thr/Pro-type tRNA ligase C-terminal domain-containing protein, partial [Candidatus Polarisedimenticolia bacterium]|nr:His/Gly/Thr/Pro-type tRNA ligase C-terminal domain-containing protein [Candidatus Polarisedimenticolia bacterium]